MCSERRETGLSGLQGGQQPLVDLRELSPISLAFVGDSVLELLVRTRIVSTMRLKPGALHAAAVSYVSARSQFLEVQLLEEQFTEEEAEVFRRGRNATKITASRHATAEEYRASTGFEALLGWLYLRGDTARIEALFEMLWQGFDVRAAGRRL